MSRFFHQVKPLLQRHPQNFFFQEAYSRVGQTVVVPYLNQEITISMLEANNSLWKRLRLFGEVVLYQADPSQSYYLNLLRFYWPSWRTVLALPLTLSMALPVAFSITCSLAKEATELF